MHKPDIVTAIDARLDAPGVVVPFSVSAEIAPLSALREFIQEVTGDWLADRSPPYVYRNVHVYRSLSMIGGSGFVLWDMPQ